MLWPSLVFLNISPSGRCTLFRFYQAFLPSLTIYFQAQWFKLNSCHVLEIWFWFSPSIPWFVHSSAKPPQQVFKSRLLTLTSPCHLTFKVNQAHLKASKFRVQDPHSLKRARHFLNSWWNLTFNLSVQYFSHLFIHQINLSMVS